MTRILVPLLILILAASSFAHANEWENLDNYAVDLPVGLILTSDLSNRSLLLMRSEVLHEGAASMVDAPSRIWLDEFKWDGGKFVLLDMRPESIARYKEEHIRAEGVAVATIEKIPVPGGVDFQVLERADVGSRTTVEISARRFEKHHLQTKLVLKSLRKSRTFLETYGVYDRIAVMEHGGQDFLMVIFSGGGSGGMYHFAYVLGLEDYASRP